MLDFTSALALDARSARPLYEQLYQSIAQQIRGGALPAGARMPGKRSLAAELSVSVNTVDTAYQLLAAEGYLAARERSGFFVCRMEQLPAPAFAGGAPALKKTAEPGNARQKNEKSLLPPAVPPAPPAVPRWKYDLSTGGVDTALFPFRSWGRLQKELLYSSPQLLRPGNAQGDENLRAALAEYLAAYRGVRCAPQQIVVGAGIEYLLGLVAPLLPGPAAAEDPGYPRAAALFRNSGKICLPVPVDADGLSVAALAQSGAASCYVTPSHQFPTGVTMPAPRRAALLHWALQKPGGRYIIEDDYDSEFRFDTRPLPSLQGMAGGDGPVIYLSTCSRSLAPSIRIAYMVLPLSLMPAWHARYALYSSTVSRFEQQTLCRFLEEGYFTRHLARMRNACRARRNRFAAALWREFGRDGIRIEGLHTGLHLLLQVKDGPGEAALCAAAEKAGIRLAPLSAYYTQKSACPPNTVVLGYGALDTALCDEAASALKKAFSAASVPSVNS